MLMHYRRYAVAGAVALALTVLVVAAAVSLTPSSASADQPQGPHGSVAFISVYAHDTLYGSVVAPNSLPAKGNFDELYVFPGTSFTIVSDAAPGDQNYNGGRWHVNVVSGAMQQFTSAEDVLASGLTIVSTDMYFSCPLLPG